LFSAPLLLTLRRPASPSFAPLCCLRPSHCSFLTAASLLFTAHGSLRPSHLPHSWPDASLVSFCPPRHFSLMHCSVLAAHCSLVSTPFEKSRQSRVRGPHRHETMNTSHFP
jgi:hypothetical protein